MANEERSWFARLKIHRVFKKLKAEFAKAGKAVAKISLRLLAQRSGSCIRTVKQALKFTYAEVACKVRGAGSDLRSRSSRDIKKLSGDDFKNSSEEPKTFAAEMWERVKAVHGKIEAVVIHQDKDRRKLEKFQESLDYQKELNRQKQERKGRKGDGQSIAFLPKHKRLFLQGCKGFFGKNKAIELTKKRLEAKIRGYKHMTEEEKRKAKSTPILTNHEAYQKGIDLIKRTQEERELDSAFSENPAYRRLLPPLNKQPLKPKTIEDLKPTEKENAQRYLDRFKKFMT